MSLYWRRQTMLAKIETTYGTDASPVAANAIQASNIRFAPMEGEDVDRNLETAYMGHQGTLAAAFYATLTFDVELQGSGTPGTAPAWGPLLRACGVAETVDAGVSVTYNPVSDDHESATIYFAIDTTRHVLLGARGTCRIAITAQGIPVLQFTFTGLFSQPSEATRVNPVLTGFKKPQIASKANTPTFTIDEEPYVLRSLTLDLANQVERRLLIPVEQVEIVDRADMIEMTIEAVPLTTLNPYALAAAGTSLEVELVHGTTAGGVATLNVPAAEMQRPAGLENAQKIVEWPLRMAAPDVDGDDQWTLVLT